MSTPGSAPSHAGRFSEGGITAVVLSFVFSFLATIAVGLRFWVRRIKGLGLWLEDWLILAALVFEWSYVVVVFLLAFNGGLGWQTNQLTPDTLVRASKYSLAGQTNWPIANGLIKVSICLTFIRIFFTKTFRTVATTVYCLCVGWSLVTILVGYLICTPLSRLLTETIAGHCGSTTAAYISLGVLDVVLDMAVFALPIPSLYKLQLPKHRKIALVATFALGLFTIVAGVMRLVAVVRIDFGSELEQGQVGDTYWCAIEASIGIVVACALTLRPLLDRMLAFLGVHSSQIQNVNYSHPKTNGGAPTDTLTKSTDGGAFVKLQNSLELSGRGFH